MGDQRFHYGNKIREKLGAGSFGAVYKVDSPPNEPFAADHPLVAMKEVTQVQMSLLREARLSVLPEEIIGRQAMGG